jgi:perosamine synthetase
VALLPAGAAPRRTDIIARLRARGVETTIGTYHLPLTAWFRRRGGYRPGQFPVTDDVAARALALPLHSGIREEDVAVVARELATVLREVA